MIIKFHVIYQAGIPFVKEVIDHSENMTPTPTEKMIGNMKVAHNGMLMKLFASWKEGFNFFGTPGNKQLSNNADPTFGFAAFWNEIPCSRSLASSETVFDVIHKEVWRFNFSLCSCLLPGAANHHSQSTLRPPLPPPHNHHTLSHQSANSLNRNTLRGGRNPIHAPAPGTGDGPTTPESVQLQDSWVLNSNVPLETRSEQI